MKLLMVLLGLSSVLFGVNLPDEEGLLCEVLPNGIRVWMKPSEGKFSCRIVARHPHQEAPRILSLPDCTREEFFEEELPVFIEYAQETIPNQQECSLGIVVVGPFETKMMREYLSDAFNAYGNRLPVAPLPPISISSSSKQGLITTALSYPTISSPLITLQDLKKLWILSLFQSIFEKQIRKSMGVHAAWQGVQWDRKREKYFLPYFFTTARAEQSIEKEPASLLISFLKTMQELNACGFTETDLNEAKAFVDKKLHAYYQKEATNTYLADYYASHMALGDRCPSYPIFMKLSFEFIQEIERQDFKEILQMYFRDENRLVELKLPVHQQINEFTLQAALKDFRTPSSIFEWKEEKADDPWVKARQKYNELMISDFEAQTIYEIIDTCAKNNPLQLGLLKWEIEKKGKLVKDVHPLRFLGTLFSDPHLKKCMKPIYESFFKWNGFLHGSGDTKGFVTKIDAESKNNNLNPYLVGFCLATNANIPHVQYYVDNKQWENLVIYLINIED